MEQLGRFDPTSTNHGSLCQDPIGMSCQAWLFKDDLNALTSGTADFPCRRLDDAQHHRRTA